MKLFKTTIVIWSTYNSDEMELSDLLIDAECGSMATVIFNECVLVKEPEKDEYPPPEGFFDSWVTE